jgi:hypothetical protein
VATTWANGQPAFGVHLPDRDVYRSHGLVVLTLRGDRIRAITRFADTAVIGRFGLPRVLLDTSAAYLYATGALAVTAGPACTGAPGWRAAGRGLEPVGHGFVMITCGKRANSALTAHDHGSTAERAPSSGFQ